MTVIAAKRALMPEGWKTDIVIRVEDGRIADVEAQATPDTHVETLLPAPANLHSHAFQRAMAGLTERRGPDASDSFWTWRQLMFRFLDRLTPADVRAIAAQVQMEMLEAGYAAVGEFHYLHHQPGGVPYNDPAEMSAQICAAAEDSGIGLTLLPVLYQTGGLDGRGLGAGQIRFGSDHDLFGRMLERGATQIAALSPGPTASARSCAPPAPGIPASVRQPTTSMASSPCQSTTCWPAAAAERSCPCSAQTIMVFWHAYQFRHGHNADGSFLDTSRPRRD